MSTVQIHNHFSCARGGCDPRLPLTLADKLFVLGRDPRQLDERTGREFCADCLADLPADGYLALAHWCGEPAGAVKAGDVVWYHGALTGMYGVYEVAVAGGRGLRLLDVDRVLDGVPPGEVTLVENIGWVS